MSELEYGTYQKVAFRPREAADSPILGSVLACVDTSPFAQAVLSHAAAMAAASNAHLTVMRVSEPPAGHAAVDPVDWTLQNRGVETELRRQVSTLGDLHADAVVIGGPAAERICAWVRDNNVDLTVLGVGGESQWPFGGLGGTARRIAEAADGSVLIVPTSEAGTTEVRYRRVLTPLDGSSRSECALPMALRIAAAHDAELVLVHATPNVDLTETGPLEAEAVGLRDQLRRRNERVAAQYLKQVCSRLPCATATRTRVLPIGDPRHAIARAAVDERADIIVLSSTGSSGHPDLSVGSVADYLINHAELPILLVRGRDRNQAFTRRHIDDRQAVRLPSRALM